MTKGSEKKTKEAKKNSEAKTVKKTDRAAPKKIVPKPEPLPEVVQSMIQFLDERKAENIIVLDMRPMGILYDYFVVATAANAPHVKALSEGLQRLCKNEHYKGFRVAGTGESGWVIVDYDGVMAHVFSAEMRSFYDLEELWKDAKRVPNHRLNDARRKNDRSPALRR